jgi:methylamine--corrinoid protein Co-methyltransferase
MADRVWQAAWDLFREVGYYNTDSHRLIQVTDEEIREALYMAHDQYWVGGGKDAVLWKHREVEDPEPPFCIMSPDITCDEQYHQSICMAYLKEPLLDGICGPILEETFGHLIESSGPTEISGCIQHIYNQKMAARLLGRPGTFMVAVGRPSTTAARLRFPTTSGGFRKQMHGWWVR